MLEECLAKVSLKDMKMCTHFCCCLWSGVGAPIVSPACFPPVPCSIGVE